MYCGSGLIKGNACRNLTRKCVIKPSLGRPRRGSEDNIKLDLKLSQVPVQC